MRKEVKTQDILKENIHQRFVRSVNRLVKADDKSAFHLLDKESTIPNIIFDKVENKDPKTILVIDDLTCEIAREFLNAEVTLALSSYRVPDIVYNIVKARIEKYFSDVKKSIKVVQLKEIYDMENKFDLIIANPPYNMGNTIISNCVDKAKECVVLMPFSKYKANELYKHVLSLEIVDPKAFKDAVITTNLCVCKLIPNKIERTFEELEIETFDQRYREFYELNQKMPNKITYPHATFFYDGADKNAYETAKNDLINWWKDHNKKFCLTWRAVLDGTHSCDGDAYDVLWNVKKQLDMDNLPISQCLKRNNTMITISLVDFKTEKECSNFTKFFYANGKDGLMNALVKGMKKVSGTIQPAIPNIDWSIDRDYEHLTYEELLQIMKDELANQSK